ncbi:MAG: lipopolysaccharide assembly protein LapA domain-containing protein [Acidobacteriota bacterium]
MRILVLILTVILLACLATYTVLNIDERVDINLPWASFHDQPQIYLVLGSLLAGVVFVGLLSVIDGIRLRFANRRLRRRLGEHLEDPGPSRREDGGPPDVQQTAEGQGHGMGGTPRGGPFRDPGPHPSDRPVIPTADRDSEKDDTPPYGV